MGLSVSQPVMRVSSSMGQLTPSAPLRARGVQKHPTVWVKILTLKETKILTCVILERVMGFYGDGRVYA